jgi:hypothetical protein
MKNLSWGSRCVSESRVTSVCMSHICLLSSQRYLQIPFALRWLKSKSRSCYDRRSVGQSILVSSPHLGSKSIFLLVRHLRGLRGPLWRQDGSVAAGPRQLRRDGIILEFQRDSWQGILYCGRWRKDWAREAEESPLLEAVARKQLVKTQQAGKSLEFAVAYCGD